MNLQTQRLLGQQSLAEFMGLHVDIDQVFRDNQHKEGVQRKNKFIINTGDNMTAEERELRIKQNQEKYGLSQKEINEIKLQANKKYFNITNAELLKIDQIINPKNNFSTIEKLVHLHNLRLAALKKLEMIRSEREAQRMRALLFKPLGKVIELRRHKASKGKHTYSFSALKDV